MEIKSGDIIQLFGSRVKLKSDFDQDIDSKMVAYNAKNKPIKFVKEDISKIIRNKEEIYFVVEE